MDCIECKIANPDGNRFCGQCGAELGRTLDETVRKKGFRDRQATEMDITESVVERLMKWGRWLAATVGVILTLFAIMLGWSYHDVRAAVKAGTDQIDAAVKDGEKDIAAVRDTTAGLKKQVAQLQSDTEGYAQVNQRIAKLQEGLTRVRKDIVDLGNRRLRVGTLETTGEGPSSLSLGRLGCPPSALAKGTQVAYCAQGSPTSLFQRTSSGDLRPVSSFSPVGFQDVSTGPKPACTAASRGTFYVEKGAGKEADKPLLCARKSDNTYGWIQLVTP
jgi:hypothetical protein